MREIKWTFSIHIIASFILWSLLQIFNMLFNIHKQAASIGIIGGADGPTAIFISGKIIDWLFWINPYNLSLFAVLLFLFKPVKQLIEKKSQK